MTDLNAASAAKKSPFARWLRIGITLTAFVLLFSRVDLKEVFASLKELPLSAWVPSAALMSVSILLGVVRWGYVLRAYGATAVPSSLELGRLYMIGLFYNTYVPGGVGGDVIRGIASAKAFSGTRAQSLTASLTVAFIERVTGVIAMLAVSTIAFLMWPIPTLQHLESVAIAGFAIACLTPFAFAIARRLAPRIGGSIGNWLSHLPPIKSRGAFAIALLLSLIIQTTGALSGHVLIAALDPSVTVSASLILIPLIAATAFIPITVSGAGIREGAFAFLYKQIGVLAAHSIAASLAFWLVQLGLGAIGGLITLYSPKPLADAKEAQND